MLFSAALDARGLRAPVLTRRRDARDPWTSQGVASRDAGVAALGARVMFEGAGCAVVFVARGARVVGPKLGPGDVAVRRHLGAREAVPDGVARVSITQVSSISLGSEIVEAVGLSSHQGAG